MKLIWLHRVSQREPAEELVHVRHSMSSKSIDQPVGTAAGCHAATIAKPVRIEAIDELGRELHAEGECLNKLGVPLDPNMLSINCLTDWRFDGRAGYGEDHENRTPAAARDFFRRFLGYRG